MKNGNLMDEQYEKARRKQEGRIRAARGIMDMVFGLLIVGIGVFFLLREKFGWNLSTLQQPNIWDKAAGVLFVLYGGWRIYRGYRKKYNS